MRSERVRLDGDPEALAAELRALVPAPESVSDAVSQIIARVRAEGDRAIVDYTRRFDTRGAEPRPLVVGAAELEAAAAQLPAAVRSGLQHALENVRAVAEQSLAGERTVDLGGHQVVLRVAPLGRAAVYVPGGRAPYPSTVVMGVVPARVAGVPRVVVCAPPGAGAELDPVVLGACRLAGADLVYRMGGAHAIAALAFGTESVDPVDVIVGPGNLYVQEAKRQVFGQVAIDGFAGPSDLLLIVLGGDGVAEPEPLALDLLAQAEHGPGTLVVGASDSPAMLEALSRRLAAAPETGAVARLVQVRGATAALGLAQAFAPEHLQLVGPAAEALAPASTHAGCVFVGAAAGTAFGDYIAGSNHVLPTNGAGRFASALSPAHFRRTFTEVRLGDTAAAELARQAAPIARAEGFEQHARSMEARIGDNA